MILADPNRLYLLFLLIPLLGAWVGYAVWHRRVRARIGDDTLIAKLTASAHPLGRRLSRIFTLLGLILIIIALARPQWGLTSEEIDSEAIDIAFALDISESMAAEDMTPNRQAAAAQEIRTVLQNLGGDRVALVVFTSISFIQSPLTRDYGTLDFYLQRLKPGQLPVEGTSLGAAVSDAIEALQGRQSSDVEHAFRRADNQVIVLFTDGEDDSSSPTAAAEQARDLGIKIITIGLGSLDGTRVPRPDRTGRRLGFAVDDQGKAVISRQDRDTLQAMARITGGEYIAFNRPGDAARRLDAILTELERTALESQIEERYIDRSHLFLFPGFLLLLLSLFAGSRRPGRPSFLPFLKAGLLATLGLGAGCTSEVLDRQNEAAIQAIKDGRLDEAKLLLSEALENGLPHPELHFNLGRAHLELEEYTQAAHSFARALATQDPELRARTYYHLGLALAAQDEWRQAYQAFIDGLNLFLNHTIDDQELKKRLQQNLEVVLRQLYPPCSTFEDSLEPNNAPNEAQPLQELEQTDLTLCGRNDDVFLLPLDAGTRISVDATFTELRDERDPEQLFLPEQSGIEIALVNQSGDLITLDNGANDSDEDLATQNRRLQVTRQITDFTITADHLGDQPQGPVLLTIRATDGLEFSYDFSVELIPTCQSLQDEFEPNNTSADATELPAANSPSPLHTCPGDEDWFSVNVAVDDTLFVDLQPTPDTERERPPALQMELYRGDTGQLIARSFSDGQYLVAGRQNLDFSGEIHIRVFGQTDDEQGPYSLQLYHLEPCAPPNLDANGQPIPRGHMISEQEQERRYIRRCDTAPDLFYVTPGEDNKIEWALHTLPEDAYVGLSPDLTTPTPFGPFPDHTMHLLHPENLEVLATAEPVVPRSTQLRLSSDQALNAQEDFGEKQPLLLVEGDPGLFHLRRLDGQNQQNQDQQNQDQQNQQSQEQDSQEQDSQEQEPQEQDSESETSENQQNQDENASEDESEAQESAEESEEEAEAEKSADESEEQSEDQTEETNLAQESDEEDGEEGDALLLEEGEASDLNPEHLEILRSLEDADDNFQLQRRLRSLPRNSSQRNR